jgi:hypothetical protein
MSQSNYPNGFPYGVAVQGKPLVTLPGNQIFVDPVNGSDSAKGRTWQKAVQTITQAYALATANKHDTVFFIPSSSGCTLAEALTWTKNYTHLMGVGAPAAIAKRARIFHSFNASPAITISAQGCSFANFYFSHGRGSATNLIGTLISGGRNYFHNVHFAGPQNATEGDEATYRLVQVNGTTGENTFERCIFGNDTINRSAALTSLHFTGGSPRNVLYDCDFISMADNAGPTHILVDATGIDRMLLIKGNTTMINHGTTLTQAIDSNITDVTNRRIVIAGSLTVVNATDVADATGDGTIWVNRATATQNVIGLGINPAVS